jgi:hypothetical protein
VVFSNAASAYDTLNNNFILRKPYACGNLKKYLKTIFAFITEL